VVTLVGAPVLVLLLLAFSMLTTPTVDAPPSQVFMHAATVLIVVGWAGWLLAAGVRFARRLQGEAFVALATSVALFALTALPPIGFLSFINACNVGEPWPLVARC
jgi:hypothetical protein